MAPGSLISSSRLYAAVVTSAHGVRGHVKIKCFLEDPSQFKSFSPFLNEEGEETYKIEKIISQEKDKLIVSLEGVKDRAAAEGLKGARLVLDRKRLPNLKEDTYYHADLLGLSIKSLQDHPLGKVHALYNFGAGELLEIETMEGNLQMVLFTKEIVPEINLNQGYLLLSTEGEAFLKEGRNVS